MYRQVGKIRPMSNVDLSELAGRVGAVLSSALVQEFGRAVVPCVVVLFGSRARGRSRASSDVDLAIALDAPLHEQQRQRLAASIAAALQVDTDLVDLLSAPSHLVSQVLRHGQVVVGAGSPALGSIISRMVSEREDIAPYQRRILEERVR
jgi:predicted nucleotidyltransferase